MRRRLFAVASAISLVLLLATTAFWLTGYIRGWEADWEQPHGDGHGYSRFILEISGGGIGLFDRSRWGNSDLYDPNTTWKRNWRRIDDNKYPSAWQASKPGWSFTWNTVPDAAGPYSSSSAFISYRALIVPGWFPCLLLLLMPSLWILIRRRHRAGECPKCRYNLTGNTSGTCPECGAPVAGKAAVKA